MTQMDTGEEKVKKICELLKHQTLEPAKKEADRIITNAKKEAKHLIEEAEKKTQQLINEAQQECDKKRNLLESSLKISAKQAVSSLKQEITTHLFSKKLKELVSQELSQSDVIKSVIDSIILSLAKQTNIDELYIEVPSTISIEQLISGLSKEVTEKLKKEQFTLSNIQGGVIIHLQDKDIAIDISDQATALLLGRYLGEHLQHYIFESND